MKKLVVLCLSFFCFFGCDFTKDKIQKIDDVNNLFIINPSKNEKELFDEWFTVSTSRKVENSNAEKTIPFVLDTSLLEVNSRNVQNGGDEYQEKTYEIGKEHTVFDPFDDSIISIKLFYEGEFCYVWADKNSDVENLDFENFAKYFDKIYEKQTFLAGSKFDGKSDYYQNLILPNKKISLVLYDIPDRNIMGYFAPVNYSSSSRMEAIFADINYAFDEKTVGDCISTICHEFSHLLTYVNKCLKKGLVYETWYTEMIAMVSEDFYKNDLNASFEQSSQARLFYFVKDATYAYGFRNWQDNNLMYASYANAYAFGAFLVRNYGGAELFYEICHNDYVNEDSIVNAVNKINNTELTFNDLLKEFCYILANTDNSDKDLPSLSKSVSSTISGFTYNLDAINLAKLPVATEYEIRFDTTESITHRYLGGYGFNYLKFDTPTDVDITFFNENLIIEYN